MITGTFGGVALVLFSVLSSPTQPINRSAESAAAGQPARVKASEDLVVIPTYPMGEPDKNPIFYGGRKYQGAKGPVYPYPMLDKLSDRREDKRYRMVTLANDFIEISVLPELGGRIFTGLDKTNRYDFFYRQHVIKPALVGMAGAWISGGVEWNIPHHHRVTTFMPVDHRLVANADGSQTLWVGETELRHRMRWLVGLTLYPDRSYLEVTTRLINRTPLAHSMLCFANVAVHAGPDYQVIFPPGTEFGVQHAKREFVHWPIGREVYHKLDRSGVDLSWWKNQPSPVSIFAWNYQDDFVGGYDHGKQAGVVHVADHHVAPGKKFFTWGAGEEGRMWDKVLTDADGPYIELMAGAYSDNQPDYSWVQPYETREVREYWYPLRALGGVKNANREAAVNLDVAAKGTARLGVNTTSEVRDAHVVLRAGDRTLWERTATVDPAHPLTAEVAIPGGAKAEDLELVVSSGGKRLIAYRKAPPRGEPTPAPVTPPPAPKDVKTQEELYLAGLRLEQFHNPAIEPYPYYEEALRRDPNDYRANVALAILYCKRGLWAEAQQRLERAVGRATRHYTSPKDTEAFYYLGVALRGQGKQSEADEAFHQAAWGHAWAAASHQALAESACRRADYAAALEFIECALATNAKSTKALVLKALVLRKLGRPEDALAAIRAAQQIDPLDFWSGNEAVLGGSIESCAANELFRGEQGSKPGWNSRVCGGISTIGHLGINRPSGPVTTGAWSRLDALMRGAVESYLEVAADYAACGAWDEAIGVLTRFADSATDKSRVYPMVYYDLAWLLDRKGDAHRASGYRELAAKMPVDYCFPFRLESIEVLQRAIEACPRDGRAPYYLGNLLYDIQPRRAIAAWERARELDPRLATVHRNLGLAYARVEGDYRKAVASLAAAVRCDPGDPRLFTELDQVSEGAGVALDQRLATLEKSAATVALRDDSLLRRVNLCLMVGRYEQALELLSHHHFRRWEGENGPHAMFVEAHLLGGQQELKAGRVAEALRKFRAALEYPENFETGRPLHGGDKAAQIHCLLGMTLDSLGRRDEGRAEFRLAAAAPHDAPLARYYHGLAQRKLGREDLATKAFDQLIHDGEGWLRQGPRVDFFGIFGTPQSAAVQAAEAHYLIGLGLLGKGARTEAREHVKQAAGLNPNHLGIHTFSEPIP